MTIPNEPFPGTPAHRKLHPELYTAQPAAQGYSSGAPTASNPSGMSIDQLTTRLYTAVEDANLPAFCETYLQAGWGANSPMIAAGLAMAFPQQSKRVLNYFTLAETVRRAVEAYRPGTLKENPVTILKNLELAVVNDDKAMYDEARAKDPDGRIAETLLKYYQFEQRTDYFNRALEWDSPHKVNDATRFLRERR